ncbi:apolipoprotein N-acyltransferase [Parasulfuritortus cantonensis]|uniref:Apolipoprotein N-acyltransferase n=1 Tax=Parasulfuritortus cantonensis TaxID=2528202 RepID=A0A4R1B7H3_9PROT|nr:apolipoprotein N-acyltransferase [Parasulfuritortus cantonensis]TCJ12977.1 apolipoprotein N-acyltransferase [Parasulfuritortus cantonensis]
MRLILATRLLPLLLGGISVLGFAPHYLFPLPVLALAGLFRLLRDAGQREAALRGWLFGLGWFGAGVSWVYVSMHDVGGLPVPLAGGLTLLFAAFLALFPALATWLPARWARPGAARLTWLLPACWALAEWLRGWLLTGFPWQALGYSQAPYGPLAAYAPLLGVYGVSWLAALSAGALAGWRVRPLALVALVWLAGLGLARVDWTRPVGAPITVSLLQGNIAQDMKFRPEKLADTLILYRDMILASDSRLIVLPETAWPLFLDVVPDDYLAPLRAHVRGLGGHLLVGVPERDGRGHYYNSVALFDGGAPQVYRKSHLVPFGEFVPWGTHWFVDAMAIPLSDFSRGGRRQAPLRADDQRIAANVCYEDVFGEELRHALPEATLMVNVSNDAWFGDSYAPWQHHQIAQMRALETGRWWLKVNNTGVTAILDAKGRTVASLKPFSTGILDGAVQGMTGSTPYARWGNGAFLALVSVALALCGRRAR